MKVEKNNTELKAEDAPDSDSDSWIYTDLGGRECCVAEWSKAYYA